MYAGIVIDTNNFTNPDTVCVPLRLQLFCVGTERM